MNVLLIATNRTRRPLPVIPFGACLVAEATAQRGHRVALLDLMFERDPLRAVRKALRRVRPDVIGLSIRNVDNNDMQRPVAFDRDIQPLLGEIRRLSAAPLVVGGAAAAVMPREILQLTGADCLAIGDGEAVFPDLLTGIAEQTSRGKIIDGRERQELSAGPLVPDFRRWIDVRAYAQRFAPVPLQSKRGCPYKCIYCTYALIEGGQYRLCPPENVAAAVAALARQGMKDIEFVDNVFNSPCEHAMAICDLLARNPSRARLQTLDLNPRFIDDALLTAMEGAGFVAAGIGAESAADAVLQRLDKNFSAADVQRAADCVARHAIPCLWIFMLGGPGETEATVRQTLDFAAQRVRPADTVFFNIGIRIYPGTPLEKLARDEGALSLRPDEMLEPVFYFSPEVRADWLTRKVEQAIAAHPNHMHAGSFAHPLLPAIQRVAYFFGLPPPLWRHTRTVRRWLGRMGMNT